MTTLSTQVKSGLRLAAGVIGVISILFLLIGGLHFLTIGTRSDLVLGIAMVMTSTIVCLATVVWWAKWFFGACCVYTLTALVTGVLGRTATVPSVAATGGFIWELIGILVIIDLLSYRFLHDRPNCLDSISLVGAIIAFLFSFLAQAPTKWMLLSVLFLAVSFAYGQLTKSRLERKGAGCHLTL